MQDLTLQDNNTAISSRGDSEDEPHKCWRELVRENGMYLSRVPHDMRTPSICLEAVRQNGRALMHVPEAVQTPAICLAAVRDDPGIFHPWVKRQTEEVCQAAVERQPWNLRHVQKQTTDICLAAVRADCWTIRDADPSVLDERICLEAVKQNGLVLMSIPLKSRTYAVCMAAVENNGLMLGMVPPLLLDREICETAVRQNAKALYLVPKTFMDEALCLHAVEADGWALKFVPPALLSRRLILAAVSQNGQVLRMVTEQDREICEAAVHDSPDAISFVRSPEFVLLQEVRERVRACHSGSPRSEVCDFLGSLLAQAELEKEECSGTRP